MNRYLLFLALAYAYHQATAKDAAVVVKGWKVLGVGEDSRGGRGGAGTAVANALQNLAKNVRLDDCDIFLTYTPTELCLGMSRICRIKSLCVIRDGQIQKFQTNVETVAANGFLPTLVSPPELKQVQVTPIKPAPLGWESIPDIRKDPNPSLTAFAWWRKASVNASKWYEKNAAEAVSSFDSAPGYSKVTPPDLEPVPAQQSPVSPRRDTVRETLFMTLTYALVRLTWDRMPDWEGNRVACILVDSSDRIVGWGINMKDGQNVTWHGETVTIRRYLAERRETMLPQDLTLYTSLKPCHMCAGMIHEVAPKLRIIYGQDDPEIKNSAVDRTPLRFAQRGSCILHSSQETFPALLARLLQTVNTKNLQDWEEAKAKLAHQSTESKESKKSKKSMESMESKPKAKLPPKAKSRRHSVLGANVVGRSAYVVHPGNDLAIESVCLDSKFVQSVGDCRTWASRLPRSRRAWP